MGLNGGFWDFNGFDSLFMVFNKIIGNFIGAGRNNIPFQGDIML